MANSPIRVPPPAKPSAPRTPIDSGVAGDWEKWRQRLAGMADAESSVALTLDLMLHDLAEQARAATGASGAAIALRQDDALVCRAASGTTTPDLGVPIEIEQGLSGECVRTAHPQVCQDTEHDARVDAAASRQLGVRSVAVIPLLREMTLEGVLEAFSPAPGKFDAAAVHALEGFGQKVVQALQHAERVKTEPAAQTVAENKEISKGRLTASEVKEVSRAADAPPPARSMSRGNLMLTAAVVMAAVLLGWLWGLAQTRKGRVRATTKTPAAVVQGATPAGGSPPVTAPAAPQKAETVPPPEAKPAPRGAATSAKGPVVSPGGLTVYEKGKIVFHLAPAGEAAAASAPANSQTGLPEGMTGGHLIQRVNPVYPPTALEQRLQGDVVLQTVIAEDGTVREVTAASGDSLLAAAATDAVKQWRYEPFLLRGTAVAVSTTVTVHFSLP
jgi:TonB family protein